MSLNLSFIGPGIEGSVSSHDWCRFAEGAFWAELGLMARLGSAASEVKPAGFQFAWDVTWPRVQGAAWLRLKIKEGGGYAGVGPCFHLPGFHFATGFLSHSQVYGRV